MLLFVYNADSGKLNAFLDTAHKLLSPATYQCKLCELTYGVVSEKQAWKKFHSALKEEVSFLHRDEFEEQYHRSFQYPVLLRVNNHALETLLNADDFDEAGDLDQLISLCRAAIAQDHGNLSER